MKKWEQLVDQYISYCEVRGLRKSTLLTRETELFRWGRWIKKKYPKIKIADINLELIHGYIKSRTTFLSKSATCGVLTNLRGFGDFLVESGYWIQNPMRWVVGPKLNNLRKIPKTYHRSDLKKIFEESFNGSLKYFRSLYPAIISIFYTTGMRKSELLNLNLSDWDRENSTLKVYGSKTGRDRVVPLPEVAWRCLESYLCIRYNLLLKQGKTCDALFVNRNGDRVNGTQILVQFKRIAKRAGVAKATIHMFRHSCASGLIEEGVPLPQVSNILGHSCSVSTFRYLNIADPKRKKAMLKHPINKILTTLKEVENEGL